MYHVVNAQDIYNGLVDNFTIRNAYYYGMYMSNASVCIANCKFRNNNNKGVYACNYSYPALHNCLFTGNPDCAVYANGGEPDLSYCIFDGNNITSCGLFLESGSVSNITDCDFIRHNHNAIEGSYATIDVEKALFEHNLQNGIKLSNYSNLDIQNSVIRQSGEQGINISNGSSAKIINNWIHNNGTANNPSYGAGIYFANQNGTPKVWNNTIYDNNTYGIECSQYGADPNILNCIISGNDINDLYRPDGSFNKVNFCLLQNPHSGTGNLTGDAGFKNPSNPNDLHIGENSQCKNAGDPCGNYDYETDIDGEERIRYGRIDLGGDEYY